MKKLLCIILSMTILLSFTACSKGKGKEESYKAPSMDDLSTRLDETEYKLPENVDAYIVEESVSNSYVAINVVNTSDKAINYPVVYKLQKLENGKWYELVVEGDIEWDSTIYTVESNTAKKVGIGFLAFYGKLHAGTYRIVRPVYVPDDKTNYFMTCEFTVK